MQPIYESLVKFDNCEVAGKVYLVEEISLYIVTAKAHFSMLRCQISRPVFLIRRTLEVSYKIMKEIMGICKLLHLFSWRNW